jgi:molecular chaperone GrpE
MDEIKKEIEKLKKDSKEGKEKKKDETHSEKLGQEIKEKDDRIKELTETLQRLQAEFENYNKRVENEKKEIRMYAEAELVKKLLPVLDSFEIALKNNSPCGNDNDRILKGMEMIYAQLFEILEDEGLRKIESSGKRFDPYYHEVLMTEQDNKKDDEIILEELQKGFMFNDKVLRYSKVKVNKRAEEVKNEDKH